MHPTIIRLFLNIQQQYDPHPSEPEAVVWQFPTSWSLPMHYKVGMQERYQAHETGHRCNIMNSYVKQNNKNGLSMMSISIKVLVTAKPSHGMLLSLSSNGTSYYVDRNAPGIISLL